MSESTRRGRSPMRDNIPFRTLREDWRNFDKKSAERDVQDALLALEGNLDGHGPLRLVWRTLSDKGCPLDVCFEDDDSLYLVFDDSVGTRNVAFGPKHQKPDAGGFYHGWHVVGANGSGGMDAAIDIYAGPPKIRGIS